MSYFHITATTTEAQLKQLYTELAKIHHPDKFAHLGAEAEQEAKLIFQDIQAEYEVCMLSIQTRKRDLINPEFANSELFKGIHAAGNELLTHLGLSPIEELLPAYLEKVIDGIKLPPEMDEYKPFLKMLAVSKLGKPENVAKIAIACANLLYKKFK